MNINFLKMNAEQVALFRREYAEHKIKEQKAITGTERDQEAAMCALLEKLALSLGISQTCLSKAIIESTVIH